MFSMHKFGILTAFVAISALSLATQARDSMDGCGLGWEVTDSATFLGTSTRATTNVFVPPTFGMTTGTLGCKKLDLAASEMEPAYYVANNSEVLKAELAQGEGEYVRSLAAAFSCSPSDSQNLGAHLKSRYDAVVTPAENGEELYRNIKLELRAAGLCQPQS
ncbi:MAG: hypothetical protein COT74_06915 [Bdellovibrionales bacterium CG10_big_fil_rev_8_21_14_0_10_45_34]|nr:MAG: hypothetical protein COT74_06915 [Bdellovibrionales bacterium CG10_big_fil_rev_8_21_14_0_10_45_34]